MIFQKYNLIGYKADSELILEKIIQKPERQQFYVNLINWNTLFVFYARQRSESVQIGR